MALNLTAHQLDGLVNAIDDLIIRVGVIEHLVGLPYTDGADQIAEHLETPRTTGELAERLDMAVHQILGTVASSERFLRQDGKWKLNPVGLKCTTT